jgi:hypothetical protein
MIGARANAQSACDDVQRFLSDRTLDVFCFVSDDLTTNNDATTPVDNPDPTLLPGALTPQTDRATISPAPPDHTPIFRKVPGIQVQGRFADDPTGQARFLLRLPNDWNHRLVVAGASGTRSEFNGDFAWSDFVVQRGYAYASQNKGVLNLFISTPEDPLACRLNPSSPVFVHFYDNDPPKPFTQWQHYIVRTAELARGALNAHYGRLPRRTYAVGTSNGGYQVRRAVELAPHLFDGGVDWEGTYVDDDGPNLLIDLPPAIRNMPAYVASGYDPNSEAALNIRSAGYPPDIPQDIGPPPMMTLWERNLGQFWEVTQCQWQKRLDPTYDTYVSGPSNYVYYDRTDVTDVADQLEAFETTGRIRRPLVTVAGTMDGLLPIRRNARAYAAEVTESRDRRADYRLYEVQNGNHIETYNTFYSQLELIQPHAQHAFELLVEHVEHDRPLPPSQCIPRGGSISHRPAQPGHCRQLFVPVR